MIIQRDRVDKNQQIRADEIWPIFEWYGFGYELASLCVDSMPAQRFHNRADENSANIEPVEFRSILNFPQTP